MQFNLNDNSLLSNGVTIFNDGIAGRAVNVSLSLERKAMDDMTQSPDINFFYTDANGGVIKDGYYRFAPDHSRTNEENEKNARTKLGRLLSISNSIVDPGFQYPDTNGMSPTQVEDLLLNTIANFATPERKVNIFVTYGRKTNPSQYLRVRMFNFIERADVDEARTRLVVNPKDDNMERFMPDQAPAQPTNGFGATIPPAQSGSSFWGNQQI